MKLTKAQQKEYEALRNQLEEAGNAFNTARQAFEEFRDGVCNDLQGSFDDKSERWQESDAGQNAQGFINEWEDEICDEVDVDFKEYPMESDS